MTHREVRENAGRYQSGAVWVARVAVGLVCFFNLTAAIPFVLGPSGYVSSFQLADSGLAGEVMVRGLGILFLMWQVPFVPVILDPVRHRTAFLIVLAMQLVGLVGESWMLVALPAAGYDLLRATGMRFVGFDSAGLVVMTLAYWALFRRRRPR